MQFYVETMIKLFFCKFLTFSACMQMGTAFLRKLSPSTIMYTLIYRRIVDFANICKAGAAHYKTKFRLHFLKEVFDSGCSFFFKRGHHGSSDCRAVCSEGQSLIYIRSAFDSAVYEYFDVFAFESCFYLGKYHHGRYRIGETAVMMAYDYSLCSYLGAFKRVTYAEYSFYHEG